MDFRTELDRLGKLVNGALEGYAAIGNTPQADIYKAMRYSLMAGGKRLRPVLALTVCTLLDGDMEDVMPYACGLEMIHTYSLIHDDLPAMDNDDFRRGSPTSHKVFGEAMAILAGDALLNRAFEVMLGYSLEKGDKLESRLKAIGTIAAAAGAEGMIGGQVVDLQSEGRPISGETLEYMHRCKTGALISAAVLSSAVLCGAGKSEFDALGKYASCLGLAFQIKDDILDVEGTQEMMGKAAGSDTSNQKSTFVTLYGLDESKKRLRKATADALGSLEIFGGKAGFLRMLAEYVESRDR